MCKKYKRIKIVHIICQDKFTEGYIRFMKFHFDEEISQLFIVVTGNNSDTKICEDEQTVLQCLCKGLNKNTNVLDMLVAADKIIVSGLFMGLQNELVKLNRNLISKMYLQFWGGDFYKYRNRKITGLHTFKREMYDRKNMQKCIRNCAGIINLIDTDWDEFYKIFPFNVKHFTAPVPSDPAKTIDYNDYRIREKNPGPLRIQVGNSATRSNHHKEVFELLKRYKQEDIDVIVPLSYGNDTYKNEVIELGRQYFGSCFIPVTEYMDKKLYVNLLNKVDIGIFNVDRQQGMGNINILFSLGKKVFINRDNPMWSYYQSFGVTPYNIADIKNFSFEEFKYIDTNIINKNIFGMTRIQDDERKVRLWRKVFNDVD